MIVLNRDEFFSELHDHFTDLNASQIEGLNEILDFMANDPDLTDIRHAAYMLATARHETYIPKTKSAYHPVTELGSKAYFTKYDGRRDLGNVKPGDGYLFRGRGYPQTTGRRNYTKLTAAWKDQHPDIVANFVEQPELLLEPEFAYFSMSYCMRVGMFTGKKLSDYINDDKCDYYNARRIINGADQATKIAEYAVKLEKALEAGTVGPVIEVEEPVIPLKPTAPTPTLFSITEPNLVPEPVKLEAVDETGFIHASADTGKRLITWITNTGISIGAIITAILTFAKNNPVIAVVIIIVALAIGLGGTLFYQHLMDKADAHRRAIAADPKLNSVK